MFWSENRSDYYHFFQFNLAIKDIPEVTHEAKKALAGQLPGIGRSMCVEISLKTSEVKPLLLSIFFFCKTTFHPEDTLSISFINYGRFLLTVWVITESPLSAAFYIVSFNLLLYVCLPLSQSGRLDGVRDLVPGNEWKVSGDLLSFSSLAVIVATWSRNGL